MVRVNGIKRDIAYRYNGSNPRWEMRSPLNNTLIDAKDGHVVCEHFINPLILTSPMIVVSGHHWTWARTGATGTITTLNKEGGGIRLSTGTSQNNDVRLGDGNIYAFRTDHDMYIHSCFEHQQITDSYSFGGLIDSTGNYFIRILFDPTASANYLFECQNGVGNLTRVDSEIPVVAGESSCVTIEIKEDVVNFYLRTSPTPLVTISTNIPASTVALQRRLYIKKTDDIAAARSLDFFFISTLSNCIIE